ncbi:hypothetical protein Moror_11781 [Moniliophthora roreri MCA 2997]|uniref:Uncharacterized protein n=1 Tax=Moniliophthora roreri (strain MCA 2997) TaxID=1381753 RepID=V2WR10_MONRO|nr:hypothetical protein Moror_11781 [Moniliophthora roreri MCA 2997]
MSLSVAPRPPRYIPPVTINVPSSPPHDTINLRPQVVLDGDCSLCHLLYDPFDSTRNSNERCFEKNTPFLVLVDAQTPKILSGMEE